MPVDEEWCCEGWSPVACRAGLHKPELFNCGDYECSECTPRHCGRIIITEQV